jgi:hypothetical protein
VASVLPNAKPRTPTRKSRRSGKDKLTAVKLLGEFSELPGSAVISLQTGSKTSYDMYVKVQNELEAGIR